MEDHPHSLKAACITAADADVYHKPRRTKFEPFDCSAAFRFCLLKPSSISAIRQTRPKSHEARPALTRAAQAYSALKNSPDSKVEKMENNGERKAIKTNALLIRLVRPRRTAGQPARPRGRPPAAQNGIESGVSMSASRQLSTTRTTAAAARGLPSRSAQHGHRAVRFQVLCAGHLDIRRLGKRRACSLRTRQRRTRRAARRSR